MDVRKRPFLMGASCFMTRSPKNETRTSIIRSITGIRLFSFAIFALKPVMLTVTA